MEQTKINELLKVLSVMREKDRIKEELKTERQKAKAIKEELKTERQQKRQQKKDRTEEIKAVIKTEMALNKGLISVNYIQNLELGYNLKEIKKAVLEMGFKIRNGYLNFKLKRIKKKSVLISGYEYKRFNDDNEKGEEIKTLNPLMEIYNTEQKKQNKPLMKISKRKRFYNNEKGKIKTITKNSYLQSIGIESFENDTKTIRWIIPNDDDEKQKTFKTFGLKTKEKFKTDFHKAQHEKRIYLFNELQKEKLKLLCDLAENKLNHKWALWENFGIIPKI